MRSVGIPLGETETSSLKLQGQTVSHFLQDTTRPHQNGKYLSRRAELFSLMGVGLDARFSEREPPNYVIEEVGCQCPGEHLFGETKVHEGQVEFPDGP